MSDEIVKSYESQLAEEMRELSKQFPLIGQLFVEMMQSVTTHENALEALNQYSAHLEAGRQEQDWKLSILKDLAVQSLKRTDPGFELNVPGFDDPSGGQVH